MNPGSPTRRAALALTVLDLAISVVVIGSYRAGWLGESGVADRWLLGFVNSNLALLAAVAFLAAAAGARGPSAPGSVPSRRLLLLTVGVIALSELGLGLCELTPSLGDRPIRMIGAVQILARMAAVGFAVSLARAQPSGRGLRRLVATMVGSVGIGFMAWQAIPSTGAMGDLLRTSLILCDAVAAIAVVAALSGWLGERVGPRELLVLLGLGLYLFADLAYYRQEAVAVGLFFGELGYFGGLLAVAWGAAPDWERRR